MSDSFPPNGQTPAGRPSEGLVDTGPERGQRPVVMVALIVVALAIVGAAAYLLLGGSGSGTSTTAVPSNPSTGASPRSTAPTAPAPETLPATFDGISGTDPFRPVVVPPAPVSVSPAAPALAPTSTPDSFLPGTLPLPSVVTVPGPAVTVPGPTVTVTATATPSPSPSTPRNWVVHVDKVAADNSSADITVNGQLYPGLHPGDRFADVFQVLVLSEGTTASIQFGDTFFSLTAGGTLTVG